MPLERFQLLAVLQAHDMVREHGLFDEHRRLHRFCDSRRNADRCKRGMDAADQPQQRLGREVIVRGVSGDDLCGQLQQPRRRSGFGHSD
jgi:hypothetical protein